jgi:endonuclease III
MKNERIPASPEDFVKNALSLQPLREGVDFWEGESTSLMCLELLLNQKVGVERATAAALAIHYHFGKSSLALGETISEATKWPYSDIRLRVPAAHLRRLIGKHIAYRDPGQLPVSELTDSAVGALASLERYYNRANSFFGSLRSVDLQPEVIGSLTLEDFYAITELRFPRRNLRKQLTTVAALLEMKRTESQPDRWTLKALERVGDETADTLLVFLFDEPALIVDAYLRRIFFRHFLIDRPNVSRSAIARIIRPHIRTNEEARKLHARLNEAGVLYCFAEKPNCLSCPFGRFSHRI